jgi:hypothetical protein
VVLKRSPAGSKKRGGGRSALRAPQCVNSRTACRRRGGPHIRNGDLRALAIMSNAANPALPDVPPIAKINPAYAPLMQASGFFYGVWVKKGTPQPVIDTLSTAYKTAFSDPGFQDYARHSGLTLMGLSGQPAKDFAKSWQSEMAWLIFESGGATLSPAQFGIARPAPR